MTDAALPPNPDIIPIDDLERTDDSACLAAQDGRPRKPGVSGRAGIYFNCDHDVTYASLARSVRIEPKAPLRSALRILFGGPNRAEREAGFQSPFNDVTADLPFTVRREGDVAVVDLDPGFAAVEFAFVSPQEIHQIGATVGQFPGIERVSIYVGGRPVCHAMEVC